MKKMWKMSHLVKIYLGLLILVFFGIVIYLNVFALGEIREREIAKEQDTLANWVTIWDNMLENNTIFIENFVARNEGMVKLGVAKTHEDEVYALQEIKSALTEYSLLYNGMTEVFFYAENLGEDGYLTNTHAIRIRDLGMAKERIAKFIRAYEAEELEKGWLIRQIEGHHYLIYMRKKNNNYIGCWCAVDDLIRDAVTADRTGSSFFVADKEGVSVTDGYLEGVEMDLSSDLFYCEETGCRYWQVVRKSGLISLYFIEHLEKGEAEAAILKIRNFMILACGILGILLLLLSIFFDYVLYRPIRQLVKKMQQIAGGNFETRITDQTRIREVEVLNETFNQMADEIRDLKIAVYEDEIRQQKIRLQYLQVQIRPHFLVNALNSIRTMIDMQFYENAQQMCFHLADYFRYLARQNTDMVILSEELTHLKTFLEIQKMRRPGKIEFDCQIQEECRHCLVPPLLLQTFVENSLKYGIDLKKQRNQIRIRITKEEGQAQILISDNGAGFPGQVLEDLTENRHILQNQRECVGIHNVIARLRLFYGEQAKVECYNREGAVVKIRVPM